MREILSFPVRCFVFKLMSKIKLAMMQRKITQLFHGCDFLTMINFNIIRRSIFHEITCEKLKKKFRKICGKLKKKIKEFFF